MPPTKFRGGETPNQIARSVSEGRSDLWSDHELIVLAKAFLEASEAWRRFDHQRLDAVLLTGDITDESSDLASLNGIDEQVS